MYIHSEASIHPTIICFWLLFFAFVFFSVLGWRCWRIGYKVFAINKYIFLEKLIYTQILFVCVLLVFIWRGWTIGYNVLVVYRYVFIEKRLCTELLFDFCLFFRGGGGGGYMIGYIVLVVINLYSLRVFYTPNCYLFFVLALFCFFKGRGGRVIVVYKCIFIEKFLCTQLLFVWFFFIILLGGIRRWEDWI